MSAPIAPAATGDPLATWLKGRYLPGLDAMRGVAALTVVVGHSGVVPAPADLAVSTFFVLSGFLITWLLVKEWDRSGTISLKRFYTRRTLRIFPAYYALVLLTIVADLALGDQRVLKMIGPALFYVMNYFNAIYNHPGTSLAHLWSLGVEEQFYILWPALFIFLARRSARHLAWGLGAAILVSLVWRSVAFVGLDSGTAYVYNAFETRMDCLATGCLLAIALVRWPQVRRLAEHLGGRPVYLAVTLLALLSTRYLATAGFRYTIGFTLQALLVGLVILQLIQVAHTPLWSWTETRFWRFMGLVSYPIYLYHIWAIAFAHKVTTVPVLVLLASLAFAVLFAWGSYQFVERPFLRWRDRIGARRGAAPAASQAPTSPRS